jgi:hypothetical protein
MIYEIYTFFNKLILSIQFSIWQRTHTIKDLENNLIAMGCTRVSTRDSIIFTTPEKNGRRGKIVITDGELVINPK